MLLLQSPIFIYTDNGHTNSFSLKVKTWLKIFFFNKNYFHKTLKDHLRYCQMLVKFEWNTKKNLFKKGFVNSLLFSSSLFLGGKKRGKE